MKAIATILLLVCMIAPCLAQSKGDLKSREPLPIHYGTQDVPPAASMTNRDAHVWVYSNRVDSYFKLVNVPVDDNQNLLFSKEDTWVYLGNLGYRTKKIADISRQTVEYPYFNGTGLYRYYPNQQSTPEYYFGGFKRGAKHGNGIVRMSDGTFYAGVWKWDKLKKSSKREATEDEITEFEHQIHLIDTAIFKERQLYRTNK